MDTNKKFTPEEVAASLLKCASPVPCEGCISIEHRGDCDCADWLKRTAADLIGEQAKRIEELGGQLILRQNELLKLQEENRWIPVEERLPTRDDANNDGEILAVWVEDKVMSPEPAICHGTCTQGWYYVAQHPEWFSRWRPMPKGPEEKGGCDHGSDCKSKIPL